MQDMESLKQGIFFSVKKTGFQTTHPEVLKYNMTANKVQKNIIEGFQEGQTDKIEWKIFSNQRINYYKGSNKGEFANGEAKFKDGSLAVIKQYIQDHASSGDYLGFEYVKKRNRAYFMKKDTGDLPKNRGKIPGLQHANGVETYLVLNNGMPEATEQSILGDDEIAKLNAQEKIKFSNLENKFNGELNQYKKNMKAVLDAAADTGNAERTDLKNKLVKTDAGVLWYITGHGVKRKAYGNDPKQHQDRGDGCKNENPQTVTASQIDNLPTGRPMVAKEKCQTLGFNAREEGNPGNTYWIDKFGASHKYTNFDGSMGNPGRHSSCPSHIRKVKTAEMAIYTRQDRTSNAFGANDACLVSSALQGDDGKAAQGNNRNLMRHLTSMKEEVDKMTGSENAAHIDLLDTEKGKERTDLIKTLTKLKAERAKIKKLRQEVDAADYNLKDKRVRADGIQIKYVAWTLAGVTLLSMAVKLLNK
jgi:hypothetical protein